MAPFLTVCGIVAVALLAGWLAAKFAECYYQVTRYGDDE